MKHYQLPPGAQEYWMTAVKRGVGYKLLIGSRFAGSTQQLIKEKCIDEDSFREDYCYNCLKYESSYSEEEIVDKIKEGLGGTGRRLIMNRPLITSIVEKALELVKDIDPVITKVCKSLLDEMNDLYVSWSNPINLMTFEIQFEDYDSSHLVSIDATKYVQTVLRKYSIDVHGVVVKEIIDFINAELNTPILTKEYTNYYDLSDFNHWLCSNYESYCDHKECDGNTVVVKEGDCIKATKKDLFTSNFVTSVIPPDTFVYCEPDLFYMYGHRSIKTDFHVLLCGNVYCDGQVCWGQLENSYKKPDYLPFLYEYFWKSKFNSDLDGSIEKLEVGIYPLENTGGYGEATSNVISEEHNAENVVGILALTLEEYGKINPEAKGKINPVSGRNFFLFLYKDTVKKKLYVKSLMVSTICDISGQEEKILYLEIEGNGDVKLAAEQEQNENLSVT